MYSKKGDTQHIKTLEAYNSLRYILMVVRQYNVSALTPHTVNSQPASHQLSSSMPHPASIARVIGITAVTVWRPNPGLHVCQARTLHIQPEPQLHCIQSEFQHLEEAGGFPSVQGQPNLHIEF